MRGFVCVRVFVCVCVRVCVCVCVCVCVLASKCMNKTSSCYMDKGDVYVHMPNLRDPTGAMYKHNFRCDEVKQRIFDRMVHHSLSLFVTLYEAANIYAIYR